jgi:hypothetical protein
MHMSIHVLEGYQRLQQEAHHEHGGFVEIVEHHVDMPRWGALQYHVWNHMSEQKGY